MHGKSFSGEDAKDIFQDALVAVYRNVLKEDFEIRYSFKTYLFSVVKKMLLQRLKIGSRMEMIGDFNFDEIVTEKDVNRLSDGMDWDKETLKEMKWGLFWRKFKEVPEDCREILKMFLKGISLKEIAVSRGYKSENYAKKKKYFCKEFLKNIIEEDLLYVQIKDHESNG